MTPKPILWNLLLLLTYSLVGLALVAVWRSHTTGPQASEVAARPQTAGQSRNRAATPPGPSAIAARDSVETVAADPVAADSSAATSSLVRDLFLPDSPISSDPEVAERQRRIQLGDGASLGGLLPFPADNPWNQPVDKAEVDPLSDLMLASLGLEKGLHPVFGSGEFGGTRIGIPYVVVSSAQPLAPIEFVRYGDQSDSGPYPIPPGAPIEGEPSEEVDRHVIVLDRDHWKLYELSYAFEIGGGWRADCGAVWDLRTNAGRPAGWTSADAAGLPVFPGLVRYDEVEAGEIRHALRFTASRTRRAYVPPASHWASTDPSPILPPMGMRVRLRQDFDETGYPRDVQVILRCLKTYGMILADNGSDWFITGAPDDRWDNDALHMLKRVRGRDFEVIRMDGLVTDSR